MGGQTGTLTKLPSGCLTHRHFPKDVVRETMLVLTVWVLASAERSASGVVYASVSPARILTRKSGRLQSLWTLV